jgi:hypothetical protein
MSIPHEYFLGDLLSLQCEISNKTSVVFEDKRLTYKKSTTCQCDCE